MSQSSTRTSYRVGQRRPSFLECFKKNLDSLQLMISSNVSVKSHHAGAVCNKIENK